MTYASKIWHGMNIDPKWTHKKHINFGIVLEKPVEQVTAGFCCWDNRFWEKQCNNATKWSIDLALFVFQTFCYYCLTLLRIHGWHGLAATNGYHLMDVSGGYHPILDQPRIQCSERTNQSVSKRLNACINKMPLPIQKPCAWHGARLWIKASPGPISRNPSRSSSGAMSNATPVLAVVLCKSMIKSCEGNRRDWLKGIYIYYILYIYLYILYIYYYIYIIIYIYGVYINWRKTVFPAGYRMRWNIIDLGKL